MYTINSFLNKPCIPIGPLIRGHELNLRILKKNKIELIIALLYFAAHFLFLLDGNIFWDDWVWHNNENELSIAVKELGLGPMGLFLRFLYDNELGIYFSKLVLYFLSLSTVILIKKILDQYRFFSNQDKFFLTLFFAVAPLNITKSSLCVGNNILASFLFYLSCYLLLNSAKRVNFRGSLSRYLAYIILFLSYFTNSFLVFTCALYLMYFVKLHEENVEKSFNSYLRSYFPLIALPILFWTMKKNLYTPYGIYASYNELAIPNLELLIIDTAKSIYYAFFSPLKLLFNIPSSIINVALSFTTLFFIFNNRRVFKKNEMLCSPDFILFISGIVFLVIAIFPYLAVSKIPQFSFHESRHQVLMNLGYSFTLYYFLKLIITKSLIKLRMVAGSLVVFLILINLATYSNIHFAGHIQRAIMLEFNVNPIYRNYNFFIINNQSYDQVSGFPPGSSFYEFSGFFNKVFNEQSRLVCFNLEECSKIMAWEDSWKRRYKLADITPSDIYVSINIASKKNSTHFEKARLIFYYFLSEKEYNRSIKELLKFEYETVQAVKL